MHTYTYVSCSSKARLDASATGGQRGKALLKVLETDAVHFALTLRSRDFMGAKPWGIKLRPSDVGLGCP